MFIPFCILGEVDEAEYANYCFKVKNKNVYISSLFSNQGLPEVNEFFVYTP